MPAPARPQVQHGFIIKHRSAILLVTTVTAFLSLSTPADLKHKPWIEKDWMQWSSWDVDNTLHYSPWVSFDRGMGRETGPNNFNPADNDWSTTTWVQLESALPIREAKLREQMLLKHYDRMNAKKKQEFDQEHAGDLIDEDGGHVRVSIANIWPRSLPDIGLASGRVPLAGPARQVAMMLSNGAVVMPVQIITSGDNHAGGSNSTEYVFPRIVDGKPILSGNDSSLDFVMGSILTNGKNVVPQMLEEFRRSPLAGGFSFPTSSLLYKGRLEY